MKRILLVQPNLNPPGGGNAVAAWILQALAGDHRVTVLAWQRPDPERIDRIVGTDLRAARFACELMPAGVRRLLAHSPTELALVKDGLLTRRARAMADRFDLVITAANEADLGRPGIQYVHFPRFWSLRPEFDLRIYHLPPLVRAYRAAALRLTGTSLARMRRNLTLANSDWVAAHVRTTHGIDAVTLPPPVAGPFPPCAWDERDDAVICIGRIAPDKRLDRVIDIVAALRARGHRLRLTLVGYADDVRYGEHIRRRAEAGAGWMRLLGDLPREALGALVARHRYGIHGKEDEHFGMAVAEMVAAGCIVFVPDGGGQREIVGHDPRLLYAGADDAVEKIGRVAGDPGLQASLRADLERRRALYTADHFVARIRRIVADFAP